MIRRITLVRKAEDLTDEEFRAHWFGPHADLGRRLQGLLGYRLNPITVKSPECEWDGVAELWFESIDAADKAFTEEPLGTTLRKDAASFMAAAISFFVEEHVVIHPPKGDDGGKNISE